MGNKGGKPAASGLKPKELAALSEATRFTEPELRALWAQFASLKGDATVSAEAELNISEAEFQTALGFHGSGGSAFLRRVFTLFDENKDGAQGIGGGGEEREAGQRGQRAAEQRAATRCSLALPPLSLSVRAGLITFEEFCVSIAALTPTAKPESRMLGA
jgi:hypothetical protein